MQDAIDRLVRLYGNVCCQGSLELAELELKSELRSQLKLERCALKIYALQIVCTPNDIAMCS